MIPAIEFATCVAALSVTKVGVVNALPDCEQVDRLYREDLPQGRTGRLPRLQVRCVPGSARMPPGEQAEFGPATTGVVPWAQIFRP